MADYIDRQAALDVIHAYWGRELDKLPTEYVDGLPIWGKGAKKLLTYNKEICTAIKTIPSADVAEVIRCKNCDFWRNEENGRGFCGMDGGFTQGNFFCALAERTVDE